MSEITDDQEQQIAELEEALKLPLPVTVRRKLEAELVSLRGENLSNPHGNGWTQGTVTVGDDARINGVVVGVNLGRIVYGRIPEDDERRRLVWYLASLAAKLYRLPLRGLEERLDQGDGLALPHVYITLATTERVVLAKDKQDKGGYHSLAYYINQLPDNKRSPHRLAPTRNYDPDWVLPNNAITDIEEHLDAKQLFLYRQVLIAEAVQQYSRLILLGDPGSGKSTFVRHFAWMLAQRGLDQIATKKEFSGWKDIPLYLPILVSLRKLAGRLAREGSSDKTVYTVLRDEIQSYHVQNVDDLLTEALHRGIAMLLFDGLDEVPVEKEAGISEDRAATLKAIQDFLAMYQKVHVIVTCRQRAFSVNLGEILGWPTKVIAPFTLGQIRHFIPCWCSELVDKGQLNLVQAKQLERQLIDTIVASKKLRDMAGSPLLLTMMALVLYNKGELPRDRPQLYERILELLLGQWDKVHDGQSLAEVIGQPDWGSERILPILDKLSYEAHEEKLSEDGRGRVTRSILRDALISFFDMAHLKNSWGAAQRCLDYFEQRSGLLIPDDNDTYVFAHLTLQEHCVGRYIISNRQAAKLVLQHAEDDRWREPILLGLGVAQINNPSLIDRVLGHLIDSHDENSQLKSDSKYCNHLLLASEIGDDRDWDYLRTQQVNVDKLQRDLREGYIHLLTDRMQPLPSDKRIQIGFYLGQYGDPRLPITADEWRLQLDKTRSGDTRGYFCLVEPGVYIIGSDDTDEQASADEKPQYEATIQEPFWIARYPITNAQWDEWVQQGGRISRFSGQSTLGGSNQPVVGVTFKDAVEFCNWLTYRIGRMVRLPTEEEWEAAARGGDARRYPWGNEWKKDYAATNDDQKRRGWSYSVPVGCYPAGAAPCGALDMVGNVWEWTTSRLYSYDSHKNQIFSRGRRIARGGHYRQIKKRARCAARFMPHSYFNLEFKGLRIVIGGRLSW